VGANVDLGIRRAWPDSVLLPDGTVLVVNGGDDFGVSGELRSPQIVNPTTGAVTTLPPWPDPEMRGFHAMALLLKDGRILLGGGTDHHHGIGCERADMQLFDPPYLALLGRPVIGGVTEGQTVTPGVRRSPSLTAEVRCGRRRASF